MKKAILAILACLYLVVTSGMQLQFHYCMGHLQGTSVSVLPDAKCSSCGMEADKSGCCRTEKQWVKVNDNHQAAIIATALPLPAEAILVPVVFSLYNSFPSIVNSLAFANHSPPPLAPSGRRHILLCVFRI